jgi:hypothetical protein
VAHCLMLNERQYPLCANLTSAQLFDSIIERAPAPLAGP